MRRPLVWVLLCCPQSDEDVAAATAEANFFALVSHQYWGVWSLIQARHSPIDFDYFQYSRLRCTRPRECEASRCSSAAHIRVQCRVCSAPTLHCF